MRATPPAALLLAVLAAAALPLALAVGCSSYTTAEECKDKVTSSGECGWKGGACVVVAELPEGHLAITSIQDEEAPTYAVVSSSEMPQAPAPEGPADGAFCSQPAQTGPCRAAIPAFYYNSSSSTCKAFLYGGCQGNDNCFETQPECEAAAARFCRAGGMNARSAPAGMKAAQLDSTLADAPASGQGQAVPVPGSGASAGSVQMAAITCAATAAALLLLS